MEFNFRLLVARRLSTFICLPLAISYANLHNINSISHAIKVIKNIYLSPRLCNEYVKSVDCLAIFLYLNALHGKWNIIWQIFTFFSLSHDFFFSIIQAKVNRSAYERRKAQKCCAQSISSWQKT